MIQTVAVLDFGSQYTQVIARRVRECRVCSRIYPWNVTVRQLREEGVCGIILSGGPASVTEKGAPVLDPEILRMGVPVLGICYGMQLLAHMLGGEVAPAGQREYGHAHLQVLETSALLKGVKAGSRVWNSHGDHVVRLPKGFRVVARTENAAASVMEDSGRRFHGIQFHPEVAHSEQGRLILENFLYGICGCRGDWVMADYVQTALEKIREQVGDSRVILGLSGGVDSSVAAALIHRAIGDRLTCVFVDNGLLRLGEREQVEALFRRHFSMDLRVIRAAPVFLRGLKGVTSPERKRRNIGRLFVQAFEKAVTGIEGARFLAQGTLYPDVIESISINGNPAAVIKTHHNVGGLPKRMKLQLLEPLRELFKDEVRALGEALGLPHEVLWRHPFPGPGLAVRILGEVTRQRLEILRQADAIFIEEIRQAGLYDKLWQAFCVFLPVRTVGVMGDGRTYDYVIALRAVESQDAMTADWARLPYDLLQRVSSRIISEVRGVNRVVLDVSSKPPATIEWE